jgi:hypothetical protein
MKKDGKYNQNAGPNLIAYYLNAHLKHLVCYQQDDRMTHKAMQLTSGLHREKSPLKSLLPKTHF